MKTRGARITVCSLKIRKARQIIVHYSGPLIVWGNAYGQYWYKDVAIPNRTREQRNLRKHWEYP